MARRTLWTFLISLASLVNFWALGFLPLALTEPPSPAAALRIDSVSERRAVAGKELTLTLEGSGFDAGTRVALALDVGNTTAVLGRMETWASLQDVEVLGRWAFLANSYRGLQVADISDPAEPFIVNSIRTSGKTRSLALDGNRLLATDSEDGLLIFDVGNPRDPLLLSSLKTPGRGLDVALSGRFAFLADYEKGLRVIDIADAEKPLSVASLELDGPVYKVAVAGDQAYLADPLNGLYVADISRPDRPVLLGHLGSASGIFAVQASDGLVYATDKKDRFLVIDASDPLSPHIIGAVRMPSQAANFKVQGTRAYVADGNGGFLLIALDDPAAPAIIGRVCAGNDRGVAVAGGKAYLAGNRSGLKIVDLQSMGHSLQAVGSLETDGHAGALFSEGERLFLADGPAGLKIIDLADPARPELLGVLKTEGMVNDVKVRGGLAYLADGRRGFRIADVRRPCSPQTLGTVKIPGKVIRVALAGKRAYAIAHGSGSLEVPPRAHTRRLHVIDIENPREPYLVGTFEIFSQANDFDVAGDRVYLAGLADGLQLVEGAATGGPRLVGAATLPWPQQSFAAARKVVVKGSKAFLANGRTGLQIIDVDDPEDMKIISSVETPSYAKDIALQGDRAFVLDMSRGMQVFDVSDLRDPQRIVSLPLPNNAEALLVKEGRIHIANGQNGLLVLPLPLEPSEIELESPNRLTVRFPPVDIPGDYLLQVSDGRIVRSLPGPITFESSQK